MRSAKLLAAAVSLALVYASSPAFAQGNQRPNNKKYVATRAIAVDAQTGSFRLPTESETQELVASLIVMTNRSTEGLQLVTLANGTKAVNIDERFQSVMLARPNADGTSEVRCVTTFEEAVEFLGLVEAAPQQ